MASEVEMGKMRPNIRIEIHNNITEDEQMDVDDNLKSDNEEGEIVDDDAIQNTDSSKPVEVANRLWPNTKGEFTTGINIFDKQEQEKLQERAKRFALKPEEINNFMDADLEELHDSLGITAENEQNVRFEAVHMIGTNEMSTEDVLDYFSQYAPTGIEWIDDDSCNVIWLENISAARAIFYISKTVRGMPARGACDPFAKEFIDNIEEIEGEGTGTSILLKNKNREVELKLDDDVVPGKVDYKNSVDMSEIMIPVPPGYWRLGKNHPKAKSLLLRFAFKTDKKPIKAEKFSKYYKKYGNPNYGGLKGVISESKKKELRGIFARNKELNREKKPLGTPDIVEPELEIKNPSILVRLGSKRKVVGSSEELNIVENVDEEKGEIERKKTKLPRMRMYADDEEEKVRRKKLLQTIKRQAEKLTNNEGKNTNDLRNALGIPNRKFVLDEIIDLDPEVTDLGTKLKNRTKNLVFTVERDLPNVEIYNRKENMQSDIRSLIEERRGARSPVTRRRISPPRWSLQRSSPKHRRRSPPETQIAPKEGLGAQENHRRRHNSDYSEEEALNQKPRSKVAVVIKTQRRPTVASTIWSRVQKASESSSDSEGSESSWSEESSSSSTSSSSSSSEDSNSKSEKESSSSVKKMDRPGFRKASRKIYERIGHRSPLKITMANDHFKQETE
ncbi:hypothetical protein NQ318_016081 [Aromia moschata]|uniref:Nuclear cap-binding protein subunit 3 n=1 Tax=Aromia moschata TaxID=1265417 RepID=A0AAV8XK99_9CUCU|nr:hypothetical protein NQ318_016081 [Aromia moschata]